MSKWEFCKIEPQTLGEDRSEGEKPRQRNDRFNDRRYVFRMTAQQFTPEGVKVIEQGEEYRGLRDDNDLHKEMSEKLLAKMGQDGWEPFFTDTRSSQSYFVWHLKRAANE